jgi:hypothetical protein
MNIVHATGIIGIILCLSMVPVTTARADVVGKEPGTSPNPEDNVLKNIQRSALGESAYPTGSSGPGTRSDELVGMDKEKPEPITQKQLEQNVEKTHGGGAAVAAEELHEKNDSKPQQGNRQSK